MTYENNILEKILHKGVIESQHDFDVYMSFHDCAYHQNPENCEISTFQIHLENGLCEINVTRTPDNEDDKERLPFFQFKWTGEPIPIHFYDSLELPAKSYHDLIWEKHVDDAVLLNYKLVGTVMTVRELKNISRDFMVWTKPEYNRKFLRQHKMVVDSYAIDGETRILYCYFRILDDCDIEDDSFSSLSEVHVEITNIKLKEVNYLEFMQQQ